jgi:drug/metabolite transporter (DMT)-like permease
MHNQLTIAILAGLGGMVGWGFADFCAKKTTDAVGAIKSLVWAHAFGTTLFIIIALSDAWLFGRHLQFPNSSGTWAGTAFFGALQMIVYWLAYEAFGKGQLAVLNPIFASFPGLVAIAAVIFFGEKLSAGLAIALVLLFGGILLINVDPGGTRRTKRLKSIPGLKEIALATVLAAVWTIGWDRFISGRQALPYALSMYAFMLLAAVVLAKLMRSNLRGVPKELWKFLVLIGLGETVAYLAISWGYSATNLTSIVALVSGAFSLPTLVLAYVFLKERLSKLQWGAVGLTILGIVLVSLQ